MRVILLTLLLIVTNTLVRAQVLWPSNTNGTVTIPYYFDDYTIPEGDTRRDTFQKAVELYEKSTCIEWVQVARNETPGHVKVLGHKDKCASHTGMINWGTNNITLATWCNELGSLLHEMAHALGMTHTHQRPDRDTYVEIWKDNIQKDHWHNFKIKTWVNTRGLPYDYLSIMHYQSLYFSANYLFSMTPKNRMALFAMGTLRTDFRWSDAAWINKAYKCENGLFLKTCPKLDCKNGGYVGKDCKCSCPENTKGTLCERKTGDLFNVMPDCGGIIKKEGEITTYGVYGCVYQIIAPQCKIPQITITKASFYTWACSFNKLILRVSKSSFGHAYCEYYKIPIGQPILADSSEASIYYTSATGPDPKYGFTASIKFVKNTTWPGVIPTSQKTKSNHPAVTLKGPCDLVQSGNNSYIYSTPNFPSPVACYAACLAVFNTKQSSSLVIYEVNVKKQLKKGERFTLADPVMTHKVTGSKPYIMQVLWPFKVILSGSDHPGNGFRGRLTPANNVTHPCGEVLTLSVNETKTVTNPLINMTNTRNKCIFKIEAQGDHRLNCFLANIGQTKLFLNTNFVMKSPFERAVEGTYNSTENNIHVYFLAQKNMTEWSITCKAVRKPDISHIKEIFRNQLNIQLTAS